MIPIISSGLDIMVFAPLLTMSNMALFHVNFNFIKRVLWVPPSKILTMVIPEISSTNGALTFISFCSFGFNILFISGNMGTDLFKNFETTVPRGYYTSNPNKYVIPGVLPKFNFSKFFSSFCIWFMFIFIYCFYV